MITIKKKGIYSIKKDGSSYYRVFRKRTRIGSFLFLDQAENYFDKQVKKDEDIHNSK